MITSLKFEDLPDAAVEITKNSILDTIGVTLAASGLSAETKEIVALMKEQGGKKESSIIGYGIKAPCLLAVFANGAMGHALDYDDVGFVDGEPWGHLGITTVLSALAVSEKVGSVSGKEMLLAVTLGNEILCRMALAAARSPTGKREWFLTPVLGVFSAAATSGKLMGLSQQQLVNAFGIALSQAAGSKEIGLAPGGTMRSIYGAFPAHAGVLSSLLAERGVTATENSLEGKAGLFPVYFRDQHDSAALVADIGKRFESVEIGFKPWSSCAHTHPYIDTTLQLVKEHDINKNDVELVTAHTNDYVQALIGEPFDEKIKPQTSTAAKLSLPFTIAVAITRKRVDLADFTAKGLNDADVLNLAQRVRAQVHADVGVVQIRTKSGLVFNKKILHPRGSLQNPMTTQQIEDKFRDCASHAREPLSAKAVDQIIHAVRSLEKLGDVGDLIRSMTP
jgi:2-methylcitrate dehydratase PrpD